MPVLKNPRHEKFALLLAEGKSQLEAYTLAGFKPHRGNASKLASENIIVERVAELQQRVAAIHQEATEIAIRTVVDRYAITKEKVLDELARIAFSNMMDYVRVAPDGLPYCDFSAVDRDKGVAIQEVHVEVGAVSEVGADGERTIVQVRKARFKLADKRAALVDLGKHLQLFNEKVEVNIVHDEESIEELRAQVVAGFIELGLVPSLPAPAAQTGVANLPRKGTAH